MQKRTPEQDKFHKQGFEVGMMVAAAICVSAHGEDVVAEEIVRNVGLTTRRKAKRAGVDDYDLDILKPVFRHINS